MREAFRCAAPTVCRAWRARHEIGAGCLGGQLSGCGAGFVRLEHSAGQPCGERWGMTMLNMDALDDLARRIGRVIESSPARDIEKNIKALLQDGVQRLDWVAREEFEIQAQVLRRSREKLDALEARVLELEARLAARADGK